MKQKNKDQSNDNYESKWWQGGGNRWRRPAIGLQLTDLPPPHLEHKQGDWTDIMKDAQRFEDFDEKDGKTLSRWFWKNSNARETVLFLTIMQKKFLWLPRNLASEK